jgi:hypothetical protein
MLTRRFVLCGLIAAPAVVKAENLMKVYSLPERYATVWGVGHDLEVIEHVVWSPAEALRFARGPLYKFREVTDVIYGFDMPPLPALAQDHWTERPHLTPRNLLDNRPVVQEDGFTDIATFRNINAWRESLRPDLGGMYSVEWIQEQVKAADAAGLEPRAWYWCPEKGLVKVSVT